MITLKLNNIEYDSFAILGNYVIKPDVYFATSIRDVHFKGQPTDRRTLKFFFRQVTGTILYSRNNKTYINKVFIPSGKLKLFSFNVFIFLICVTVDNNTKLLQTMRCA